MPKRANTQKSVPARLVRSVEEAGTPQVGTEPTLAPAPAPAPTELAKSGQQSAAIQPGNSLTSENAQLVPEAPKQKLSISRQEMSALIARAKYDELAAVEVMQHLKSVGQADAFAEAIRDIASTARVSLLELCCPDDKMARYALERKLNAMQKELEGPEATALEKQLAERIVLSWLQVHYFEAMFARNASEMAIANLYQNRIDMAHRRHLSAVKALAQVRKLQINVLQFYLADQQVNIGQVGGVGKGTSGGLADSGCTL